MRRGLTTMIFSSASRMLWVAGLALIATTVTADEVSSRTEAATNRAQRPNILLIMADDLGFSDLGCYGGEIETPHLDALAQHGLRYTQFYNTGRCWPTRGSLLTGYYPQSIRRDTVPGVVSGGRGKRPSWAPLVCKPLKAAGYRTYHTGKWHLDGMPVASGFDRSYYLKDQHRFFNPTLHWKNDQKLPPVPKETDFYATIELGDHVLECLEEHASKYSEQPFFHYLAFAAPHFPLHALPEDIARYRDRYTKGWEAVRDSRYRRIKQLHLIDSPLSAVMREVGPPYHFPEALEQLGAGEVNRPLPWETLTPEQQRFQSTKMAIHAAMIDCMDRQIGRVLDRLREMGEFDNTLILFLSDNGASAEIMVRGDGHDPEAPMGSWRSHLCLGPGWSTVANTPFRYHKTWTHEGGIATPLIVHWPDGIKAAGQLRHQVGHVIDLWPTLMEVAGLDRSTLQTEREAPARPGISLVPSWSHDTTTERTLWWSHEGNRALRRGEWKISAVAADESDESDADVDWELYRLDRDRTETDDLAATHPKKLAELIAIWEAMNREHSERAKRYGRVEER